MRHVVKENLTVKNFLKANLVIVLAFLLPILLIAGVALSSYLPSLLLSTDYNFVYALCADGRAYGPRPNCPQLDYSVVDGKLAIPAVSSSQASAKVRIFMHDTKQNESREVALEEVQAMALNGLLTSPDGVTVSSSYDRGANFFLFSSGGSSYGYYLTKGKRKSKLNLINRDDSQWNYRDGFHFIGWVLPAKN